MQEKLRVITQQKIGFDITNLNDSKRLSEIVLIKIDLDINYNTIRRFFGLAKSVKASNFTLDILSKFNGYNDYNDFLINYQLRNKWQTEFKIIETLHVNKHKELIDYIKEKLHVEREFYLKFIQIVRELILVGNYKILVKIFSLKETNSKHFLFDDIVLIGNSIGKLLKRVNFKDNEVIKLILLKNFQDLVITIYVDYGNLDVYYANVINTIYKNSKRKEITEFSKGILNLNLYLNNEQPFHILNYDESFHPILKSRIYAQYILMEDPNVIKKLDLFYLKNQNDNKIQLEYFFEIIFSSIVTKNFKVMKWVINKVSNQPSYKFFFKFEHYQNFLFMELLFLLKNKDAVNLEKTLIYFSFENFNRSYRDMIDLYIYIFNYHLNNSKNSIYLKLYLKKAKEINPKFFTKKYLLNYFA